LLDVASLETRFITSAWVHKGEKKEVDSRSSKSSEKLVVALSNGDFKKTTVKRSIKTRPFVETEESLSRNRCGAKIRSGNGAKGILTPSLHVCAIASQTR